MATTTLQNYRLAGAPLIYQITGINERTGAAFHRVKLVVTVTPSDAAAADFKFSQPVNGGAITIDLSSAVVAMTEAHHPQANIFSYPSYEVSVVATEEWMTDGQVYTADLGTTSGTGGLYAGRYTDAERAGIKAVPSVWSRKPTSSVEVCFNGYQHLVAGSREGQIAGQWLHPSVTAVTVADGPGDGIYGIYKPQDGHDLQFINSMGVHENVFLTGLPDKMINITTNKYEIARQETFSDFSRAIAIKDNDHEIWTLSSGPLDADWANYFVHEVLMAKWAWLEVDANYIPCHILPDESTPIISRSKAGMLEVLIKVQMEY